MRAKQREEKRRRTGVRHAPAGAAVPRRAVLRGAAALTGAVAAGVLAAACSSSPPAPSVASLPGHQATAGTTGQLTQTQSDRDMVDYARCIRAHGVNIPDPSHRPGHAGLSIEFPPTPGPQARTAMAACNHFIEPIIQMKLGHMRTLSASRLRALTNYARCMRAHDIPMLDPTSFGALNLGNPPGVSGNFGRYTPQFHAADATCRHLLPPGVPDNGTGP